MNILLCIDIGNSTIGFGLFVNPERCSGLFIKKIPTHPALSKEAYKKIITEIIKLKQKTPVSHHLSEVCNFDTIVSSVVPSLNPLTVKAVKEICKGRTLIINHRFDCGIAFDVENPEEIGADRIANAVAGFHYFRKPVAVIDFGTATTITVVGRGQKVIGGAIMPGIDLMQRTLHEWTAKLPLVNIKNPKTALGRNTVSSITSGIIYGTAGAVESLIKNMEKELGFRLKLALTGGHAKLMSPLIKRKHIVTPHLTFEGLRLIYLQMQKKREPFHMLS